MRSIPCPRPIHTTLFPRPSFLRCAFMDNLPADAVVREQLLNPTKGVIPGSLLRPR